MVEERYRYPSWRNLKKVRSYKWRTLTLPFSSECGTIAIARVLVRVILPLRS